MSPWYSFPVCCLSSRVPHSNSLELFLTRRPQLIRIVSHCPSCSCFHAYSHCPDLSPHCFPVQFIPMLYPHSPSQSAVGYNSTNIFVFCFSSYRPWNCSSLLSFLPYIIIFQLSSLFAFISLILICVGNHIGGCRETEFMLSKIA